MDCSLPGSSAHGILQARILELVAISFSTGSSQPSLLTKNNVLQKISLVCIIQDDYALQT